MLKNHRFASFIEQNSYRCMYLLTITTVMINRPKTKPEYISVDFCGIRNAVTLGKNSFQHASRNSIIIIASYAHALKRCIYFNRHILRQDRNRRQNGFLVQGLQTQGFLKKPLMMSFPAFSTIYTQLSL